jgi:hypothetical protein
MRAGVKTLLDALTLDAGQVIKTLLAGASASPNPALLAASGFCQKSWKLRESNGNARRGAQAYLRNYDFSLQTQELAAQTDYIELTSTRLLPTGTWTQCRSRGEQ